MNLITQTEAAIQSFYHCQNSDERNCSHKWLLELQTSPEAWQVSWMLLDPVKSVECQYYGAVILHYKICHMINEVSKNDLQELRSKLLTMISAFRSGLKFILSKLCATFSALIIQTTDEEFKLDQCLGEVENFIKSTGCEPQHIILQILTELPTQFKFINMNSNRKISVRHSLNIFIPALISMCQRVMQSNESIFQMDVLMCLLGWIEFGLSIIDSISLVPVLISHIECEELSEKICEVLSELITSPTSYSYYNTIFNVLGQILQLEPLVEKAIAEDNYIFLQNICMLVSNIGETHSNMFIKATESQQQMAMLNLVKMILRFSSLQGYFPIDETCSKLTLSFWYTLQDDLLSLDIDEITEYQMQFHQAFLMLVDIYYVKAQYPPEEVFQKYTSDDKQQFRCYRTDIQDTIMYLHNTLKERCHLYFTEKLTTLLADPLTKWQHYESILFLLAGTSGTIDTSENIYIPNLIQLMKKLPNHPKVRDTLVSFLGGLAEWLNCHPQQISQILPFLLTGILNQQTSFSCSLSLKDICQDCAQLIGEESIKLILKTCHEGLQCSTTSDKVIVRLFEICGYVISALPIAQMNAEIETIATPLLQQLKRSLEIKNPNSSDADQICKYLHCYHGLYRSLDPYEALEVHPIMYVYAQMISLFPLLKPWCNVEKIVVAASNCICKAVEIVRENLYDYVILTSEVLYDFFTIHPYSCLLEVAGLLIGMFGSEEKTVEITKNFFSLLVNRCLNLMERGNEYTDCLQSLMDLLSRVIKTVPEFVYNDVDRQVAFLKCSLALIGFQESPTIKSSCNFIITYINHSSVYESGKQLIMSFGRDLLLQVLICIGSTAPRHTIDYFAEILFALNKNFVTELAIWFKDVFNNENFPTKIPSTLQKEHFQKAILREKASKSRMKQTVKDFALVCRGLHGMVYTA